MMITRVDIDKAINTLPDNLLPNLAEFVAFLQMKTQPPTSVWATRSNQTLVETQPEVFLADDSLETAAQTLYNDYISDKELTAFLSLDGEEFHA
jgi:hypothetical protein